LPVLDHLKFHSPEGGSHFEIVGAGRVSIGGTRFNGASPVAIRWAFVARLAV